MCMFSPSAKDAHIVPGGVFPPPDSAAALMKMMPPPECFHVSLHWRLCLLESLKAIFIKQLM